MVVVPAGKFRMGDSKGESNKQPVHEVALEATFALSQFEVTVGEFRLFVESADYRTEAEPGEGCWSWSSGHFGYRKDLSWRKPGFKQDDRHPVVCVSWNDARTYAQWLSGQSGYPYRLPTEAEWEYAACTGTETGYWWGDDIGRNRANCVGCGSRWNDTSTAPVGSFAANPFKIWNTAGNAWEWVEDCWHEGYDAAPSDGSAWSVGECARRVFRGGSWNDVLRNARAAYRGRSPAGSRLVNVGFRLARTL
jgi:formylglycine-generating enzyme required for sulfatase activity